jgi:Transglycosylase SLT domain/Putative peptidoglycan binding domain
LRRATPVPNIARRTCIGAIAGAFAVALLPAPTRAQGTFDQWIATFRSKAMAHGVMDDTYTRVMAGLHPDTTGLSAIHNQAEFKQQLWQYLNRATTDWKINAGKAAAQQYAPLVHLGYRCSSGGPFVQKFPNSEPGPTLAEVQEIQRRLTALGFDTGGGDGRIGNDTTLTVQNFQRKARISPADGYAGVGLLARLHNSL